LSVHVVTIKLSQKLVKNAYQVILFSN